VSENQVVIPDRAFFKASEVCEIAQVQAYVLRTWELEFPSLGVPRPGSAARIYRRQDVERVIEIKQLMFTEGLTLAGARRRLEGDTPPPPPEDLSIEKLVAPEVRERLASVKSGLRSLLTLLGTPDGGVGVEPGPQASATAPAADGELFPRDGLSSSSPPPRLTMARPRTRARKPPEKGSRHGKAGRR
jgi:DNA-binding transcriptional MerR regulator